MSEEGPATDFEIRTADWLGVGEALARVLEWAEPLADEERVTLHEALGRALAEDLAATATLPPWDNSAMDGYAVRGEDVAGASPSTPVVLQVTGVIRAGQPPGQAIGPGEAARIMTGAPLPPGADCVIRVEDTDGEAREGTVRIVRDRDVGRHVRPAGKDMMRGDRVLERGHTVDPGTLAVLAALGRSEVTVHRVPTVAILATGDELRSPERYQDVESGAGVPESNGPMIAAAVAAAGCEARLLDTAPDDADEIRRRIQEAEDADVLVTLGGASMGEADLVKRVLDGMGYEQGFWRVRMRPGSPFGFGRLGREGAAQAVFGLPGNPASAFVTFELFVRPFILKVAGHRRIHRRLVRARAGEELPGKAGKPHFPRVLLEASAEGLSAYSAGSQSSALVRGLSVAEGLAVVPGEEDGVPAGAPLDVILLGDAPAATVAPPLEPEER